MENRQVKTETKINGSAFLVQNGAVKNINQTNHQDQTKNILIMCNKPPRSDKGIKRES